MDAADRPRLIEDEYLVVPDGEDLTINAARSVRGQKNDKRRILRRRHHLEPRDACLLIRGLGRNTEKAAIEMHPHDGKPFIRRYLVEDRVAHDAGIVDDDVDAPEGGNRRIDDPARVIPSGDTTTTRRARTAGSAVSVSVATANRLLARR